MSRCDVNSSSPLNVIGSKFSHHFYLSQLLLICLRKTFLNDKVPFFACMPSLYNLIKHVVYAKQDIYCEIQELYNYFELKYPSNVKDSKM